MKPLPPSQREKTRYMKFRVHSEKKAALGDVVDAVWDSALDYLGTSGTGEANFWDIGNKYSEDDQEGVVRVNRDMENDFRAALCLVDKIDGRDGFLEVLKTSGSIKNL